MDKTAGQYGLPPPYMVAYVIPDGGKIASIDVKNIVELPWCKLG